MNSRRSKNSRPPRKRKMAHPRLQEDRVQTSSRLRSQQHRSESHTAESVEQPQRLQKILSRAGIASRRTAEHLIREGRVRVNGEVVTQLGTKAHPRKDRVTIDG